MADTFTMDRRETKWLLTGRYGMDTELQFCGRSNLTVSSVRIEQLCNCILWLTGVALYGHCRETCP